MISPAKHRCTPSENDDHTWSQFLDPLGCKSLNMLDRPPQNPASFLSFWKVTIHSTALRIDLETKAPQIDASTSLDPPLVHSNIDLLVLVSTELPAIDSVHPVLSVHVPEVASAALHGSVVPHIDYTHFQTMPTEFLSSNSSSRGMTNRTAANCVDLWHRLVASQCLFAKHPGQRLQLEEQSCQEKDSKSPAPCRCRAFNTPRCVRGQVRGQQWREVTAVDSGRKEMATRALVRSCGVVPRDRCTQPAMQRAMARRLIPRRLALKMPKVKAERSDQICFLP